jgi:hypothetical protein
MLYSQNVFDFRGVGNFSFFFMTVMTSRLNAIASLQLTGGIWEIDVFPPSPQDELAWEGCWCVIATCGGSECCASP